MTELCVHRWQDDGDQLQIVCVLCGERHDVDLTLSKFEAELIAEASLLEDEE